MKKIRMLMLCLLAGIMGAKAQIGYQMSLLNTATGEARANETIVVTVTLSNNVGEAFYSETKSATTNDFGVLSLSIGNADTFKNVDLSKMPFFIEVSANGAMIGKSQILNVPVAEVAKNVAPIDKNLIVGTWTTKGRYGQLLYDVYLSFGTDGTFSSYDTASSGGNREEGSYFIQGSMICTFRKGETTVCGFYFYESGKLYSTLYGVYTKSK